MSQILLRTIGSIDDKRLELANDQAARLFSIGNSWTQIRLGIRLAVNGAATITGTPVLALGVGAGVTNKYGDATTDHFFGIKSDSASWSWSSGPPGYYSGIYLRPTKRVGSTSTNNASVSTAGAFFVGAPTTNRSALLVDITKGSPNFTIQIGYCYISSGVQSDVSLANFIEMMEVNALTSLSTVKGGYTNGTSLTQAVDESANGNLNAVQLYWNKSAYPIEICDIAYAKIA